MKNLCISKDSEPFWKTCNSYFSGKENSNCACSMLAGHIKLIAKPNKIAETFNNYFELT